LSEVTIFQIFLYSSSFFLLTT